MGDMYCKKEDDSRRGANKVNRINTKKKKKNIRISGSGWVCIIGDDRFKIGPLSPLLPTVAIGSGGSDRGHLFTLVQDSFGEINTFHNG